MGRLERDLLEELLKASGNFLAEMIELYNIKDTPITKKFDDMRRSVSNYLDDYDEKKSLEKIIKKEKRIERKNK